ncbi:MAG: hypothetical protein U0744_08615 [Gemmataceae bacterium]
MNTFLRMLRRWLKPVKRPVRSALQPPRFMPGLLAERLEDRVVLAASILDYSFGSTGQV